jgi:RNA polymerase sigma factor (sigma-70 family)
VTDELSAALTRLLDQFAGTVRRAARSRGLGDMDTDEIMQDVRVRLWRSRASGETLEGLGPSYIYRVAMTAAIDLLRRRRADRESSLDELLEHAVAPPGLQVEPDDPAAGDELAYRLRGAMMRLAENRRVVVSLHLEGYHRDEIASLTGWTEAKVRNLLYRGLEELRTHLGDMAEVRPDDA